MPSVPEYNFKPIRPVYAARWSSEPATLKQKSLILALCKERKLPIPEVRQLTKADAATMLDSLLEKADESA